MQDREDLLSGTLDRQQLLAELRRLQEELSDIEEEETAWFLQTGHHIGRRVFQQRRREFEEDKAGLRERIEQLRLLMGV